MRRFLGARGRSAAARSFILALLLVGAARVGRAQTWNDARTLALVQGATQRRVQQLADTGLTDYQANAHGYVSFLAQIGPGFLAPPKLLKSDELEDEVYWHAPNLSKQRIIGRRDTLLLPTDIQYHMDHLGIVQNNFPNTIRIGDGDEVATVPHPLSLVGLREYDYALADSFSIGSGSQRIHVYEVKIRPKDDKQPRLVGAIYIDPASSQVVRMNFGFTRSAFLDKALEELDIVLENRLVNGRFWLPSRQTIEIRRNGEWLDYPVRGIIRGRWEIGDYRFNTSVSPTIFVGPQIVQAPPSVLKQYPWTGNVLDSLPPDVRAASDEDIERVQAEVRGLVRAQALAAAKSATISARNLSDFARYNRVEGLALGDGVSKQFGAGVSATVRARYGIDDRALKGSVSFGYEAPDNASLRVFAERDYRDLGDVAERSTVVNSLAAQEFGSDYTDPYLVRAAGVRGEFLPFDGYVMSATAAIESQSSAGVHATPVTGAFIPTIDVGDRHGMRYTARLERAPAEWAFGTTLDFHVDGRAELLTPAAFDILNRSQHSLRGAFVVDLDRPFGPVTLSTTTTGAKATASDASGFPLTEAVYLGGPVSGPGYDYHRFISTAGYTEHVELRIPVPFIPFSLGRFGRVPSRATFAPFVHVIGVGDPIFTCVAVEPGSSPIVPPPIRNGLGCGALSAGAYPSVGAAYIIPFDLLRIDVARGVGRGGRWTFNIDVSRDFWRIL
jgi:hypothetical protein